MAWRITDYNMQSISRKTSKEIDYQYKLLKTTVERGIRSFEEHGMSKSRYVKEAKRAIGGNITQRDRMHAIIDMRRFISSSHSSYSKYQKSMEKSLEFWQTQGVKGLDMDNIEEFLDFLDWERSFYGYKYTVNTTYPPSVLTDWNDKVRDADLEALFDFFRDKIYEGL